MGALREAVDLPRSMSGSDSPSNLMPSRDRGVRDVENGGNEIDCGEGGFTFHKGVRLDSRVEEACLKNPRNTTSAAGTSLVKAMAVFSATTSGPSSEASRR